MNGSCFAVPVLALLVSCSNPDPARFNVEYKGALKTMMHGGDLSAKADLLEFRTTNHLYGLGALENLKGEILIFNGEPSVSTVEGGRTVIDRSFDHRAALFVYSVVTEWISFMMPDSVITQTELERYIEETATTYGIDPDQPFPFLLEGTADSLQWHVIDWPEGDSVHTHEKHRSSGLHGTVTAGAVQVLGFYSRHHKAIFTHHSTNIHMHAITQDGSVSGHVDRLVPGNGLVLKLPAIQRRDG